MTDRTKEKIDENLKGLCATLGLDQSSPDPENQRKIFCLYNALLWTADDAEKQCNEAQGRQETKAEGIWVRFRDVAIGENFTVFPTPIEAQKPDADRLPFKKTSPGRFNFSYGGGKRGIQGERRTSWNNQCWVVRSKSL